MKMPDMMFKIAAIIFMTGIVVALGAEAHSDMIGFMLQIAIGLCVMTIGVIIGAPYVDDKDTDA
jgi:hypothetical protein